MSFLTNRASSRSWCACAGVESYASRCFYLPGSHIQRNVCQLNKDGNHNHRYQSPEVHIEERLVCVPGISSRARDSETPLSQLGYPVHNDECQDNCEAELCRCHLQLHHCEDGCRGVGFARQD